jgi:hypothetical protein
MSAIHSFPGVGAAEWELNDGDVVRWQYTKTGLGANNSAWGAGNGI